MPTKNYDNDLMKEFVCEGGSDELNLEFISKVMDGTSRWHTEHTATFKDKDDGKFYQVSYRLAATECQEHDFDGIGEAYEVTPVEKTITVYEPVK